MGSLGVADSDVLRDSELRGRFVGSPNSAPGPPHVVIVARLPSRGDVGRGWGGHVQTLWMLDLQVEGTTLALIKSQDWRPSCGSAAGTDLLERYEKDKQDQWRRKDLRP